MRRGHAFILVAGGLLLGSVALAQQGLIIDPWGRHAPRALTLSDLTRPAAKPAHFLAEPASALPVAPKSPFLDAEPEPGSKWKPEVPVDLIDPWAPPAPPASPVVTVAVSRRSWAKPLVDLVDPWAPERSSSARPVPRRSIY